MKTYKNFNKEFIGYSDIATLILVGCSCEELKLEKLHFGEDGSYGAYVVDADTKIGEHYNKIAEFENWLKIYDDDSLAAKFHANRIIVYRSGERGCIIQLINVEEE